MVRLLVLLCCLPLVARAQEHDLVVRHARIVDGTGAPAFPGDVAVRDGRIVAVGQVSGSGRTEIDAKGLVVAPGFIDVHTHTEDITELPLAENFLRMGVTTLITGNCGSSELDIADFFRRVQAAQPAVNVATLIGHGSVRSKVMGDASNRRPTTGELTRMTGYVERAMKDGALGLSTGLIYVPGSFATSDELVALARVAAAHGGIYASHMRHENYQIRAALEELVRVAREAKIPAQVSHLKLSGPAAWGQAEEILAYLDAQRASGLKISQDVYVYTAASTSLGSLIDAPFRAAGGTSFGDRLRDPEFKAKVVAEMKDSLSNGKRGDYGYAVIAYCRADPRLNGKTVPQAAQLLRGAATLDDQIETILEIQARGGASAVFHGMSEPDLETFLAHPLSMIGSDSGVRKFGEGVPHPRGYGNNARVLARYVRELRLLTLEEAVRKMTSLPARTFHLGARGELKPGFAADLVIFDPARVDSPAQFNDPHHYATGFTDVIVNGLPVIRATALTPARPGQPVLRARALR